MGRRRIPITQEMIDNPLYTAHGTLDSSATLQHYGIKPTITAKMNYSELYRKKHNIKRIVGYNASSMRLASATAELGWEAFRDCPAVYEVVCEGSGRRYIGQSTKPHLRRAVHLHFLHNFEKFSTSNSFFGVESLASDVTEHGVESFHFNVLQQMPGATTSELKEVETKFIEQSDPNELYNRYADRNRFYASPVACISEEIRDLEFDIWARERNAATFKVETLRKISELDDLVEYIKQDVRNRTAFMVVTHAERSEINDQINVIKNNRRALKRSIPQYEIDLKADKRKLREEANKIKKQYSEVEADWITDALSE